MNGRTKPGRVALLLVPVIIVAAPLAAQTLLPQPPLIADAESLPRLEGDTGIIARINAALQEIDDTDLQIATCDGENADGAFRSVETLAHGADFLSFLIEVGGYCIGAAHPWGERKIVNFDMKTGDEVDLSDYLPSDWPHMGDPPAELFALYLKAAGTGLTDECRDSLTMAMDRFDLRFDIGLDDKAHQVLLVPDGLAYVVSGCENVVRVGPDVLLAAGFHPRLIKALGGPP